MRTKLIVVLFTFLSVAESGAADRPNILYIMADDHAAHAISAYGSKVNQTPNIDRIGRDGMRFDNCFVTNSICTPSRATILTGKYSHINGVPVFNRFDGRQPTVAKDLQAAGYHTGMIGKWHLGSEPTGFDDWTILPGQGAYHDPVFFSKSRGKITVPGYCTDVTTDLALSFLDARPKEKPFFLMLHQKAPHRPWEPDEAHRAKWANRVIPEPETFNDDYATRSDAAREATMQVGRDLTDRDVKQTPPQDLTPEALKKWKYQRYMQDYLACIESLDDNVGRVLDYLDRTGLSKNTVVVYTSDQGFFLGDHGWFDKRFMFEESLKMPFLVRWPGVVAPGSTTKAMTLNVDFAPTFLAMAGVAIPDAIQGHSVVPILQGQTPTDWRQAMYYRYYHYPQDHRVQPHYGVRTERYKLICYNKIDQWELFDLQTDPHELHNLYADPAHATTVARLKAEMAHLRTELGDTDQFEDQVPQTGVGGPPVKS